MSTARVKFKCERVTSYVHGKEIKLYAVAGDEGEGEGFTHSTPNGEVEISISKDAQAYNFFEPGKEYYLDFTAV